MKTLTFLLRVVAGLAIAAAVSPASARADAVDDLLTGEIQKRHVPGLSVAVLRDGKIIKTGAYGFADLELNVPVTPTSVFQIQSITKTFTAAAVLMLVEEGKIALDDRISKHLEDTPDSWKNITIRHLLTHTSGIRDFINEPTASLRLDVTETEVLEAMAAVPLKFTPGERYAYSNTNYHLLAMILRKHTGKWYGDFLAERIFAPLGMTNTRPLNLKAIIPGRVSGYLWTGQGYRKGEFVAESILSYGGGGVLSTAPDMAHWAEAMMSAKLLKPETIREAWTPARFNNGGTSTYGLGWAVASVEGHREVNHGGAHGTGFTSFLAIYPEDRLAVVVLLNRTGLDPSQIARLVASVYLPELAPQPEKAVADADPKTTAFLREIIEKTIQSGLDESWFTPEMWKNVVLRREEINADAKTLGAFKSLELLSQTGSGDQRTSRYRAVFANSTLSIALRLDANGKIAFLESNEEQ